MEKINGASLFSSAGIAETYFKEIGINITTANELIKKRADLYSFFHPDTNMICGDITDKKVFNQISNDIASKNCKFLLATPPCQGMSSLGKKDYENDNRNYLIYKVMDIMDKHSFDYILIENVPKFLKLFFPYRGKYLTLDVILKLKYGKNYIVETFQLNASNYGVPQSRPRGFIKLYKKNTKWPMPVAQEKISLWEAIGHLPSLESNQSSNIKWHFSKKHNDREIISLEHTNEGCSAMKNEVYYPRKPDGSRIKGFHNTYKRMKWDEPCPARTINNGNMGGHNNVHPGRLRFNGTVSDARVLTLRELFIVSSLPADLSLPEWCTDSLIRTVIGEAIPPMFCKKIVERIFTEGG